jgi:hypothetical protein
METTNATITSMKGKVQLNYLFSNPCIMGNSQGRCDLITTGEGLHLLRFEVKFPEFKIQDCELIPLNGLAFKGVEFYVYEINCIQLSPNELLVGFTIFDEHENYPDTIGVYARLKGTIPDTLKCIDMLSSASSAWKLKND